MTPKQVIVCVDDEFMILDCMRAWLEEWYSQSHVIEVAESGEEALEVIRDHLDEGDDICLMITDYIMPGMKGDELLARMRELTPDTAAIMVTGQIQPDVLSTTSTTMDMFQCLSKPWQNKELNTAVDAALAAHTTARSAARAA